MQMKKSARIEKILTTSFILTDKGAYFHPIICSACNKQVHYIIKQENVKQKALHMLPAKSTFCQFTINIYIKDK